MQTFLPFSSFLKSAHCLDYKRLGKQRVEAKQILETNFKFFELEKIGRYRRLDTELPSITLKIPWENHPAVRMWRGYEIALAFYGYIICGNWKKRGYVDNLQPFFMDVGRELLGKENLTFAYFLDGYLPQKYLPEWLGRKEFHYSHQANLLRKNYEWYSQFSNFGFIMGYIDFNNIPYEWNKEYWK